MSAVAAHTSAFDPELTFDVALSPSRPFGASVHYLNFHDLSFGVFAIFRTLESA